MALSILSVDGHQRGLWCSNESRWLLILAPSPDAEKRLETMKNIIEEVEQQKLNEEYFSELRTERVQMLIKGGKSEHEAHTILRKEQPFLYDQSMYGPFNIN
jgi:hypothetical protein